MSETAHMDTLENDDADTHRTRAQSIGRVHFVEAQVDAEHSGEFVVNVNEDSSQISFNLGMLSASHVYEIRVVLPIYLGDTMKHLNPTEHNKLVSVSADKDKRQHALRMQLATDHTSHELNYTYNLQLNDSLDTKRTSVVVTANVLGKNQGTPLLKSGVRMIQLLHDESSEAESVNALTD